MRKIGILTYFWGSNPGTALQAYSTLSLLTRKFKGDSVEIISYQPKKVKTKYIWNYFHLKPIVRYFKLVYTYNTFRKNDLQISAKPLISKDYSRAVDFVKDSYDLIVVGSDTVWEITSLRAKNLAPFPNVYWLSPEIKAKKVAFSVSAGTTTVDQLDNRTLEKMQTLSTDFDLISVRDDITEKLINDLNLDSKNKIARIPDPTFAYKFNQTKIKNKLCNIGLDLTKPIAAVNLPSIGGLTREIINYLKFNGFQVLIFNNIINTKGLFILPSVTPHEWAELFKYLSISITDRFHGTVFSLRNLTPVIAIDCESQRFTLDGVSKSLSLLKEFNLDETFHFNINDINQNPENIFRSIDHAISNFDPRMVKIKLKDLERKCIQFLDRVGNIL